MFDIGFFELLVIGIVGLLVIGPERLPDAVRTTARMWSRLRRTLTSAREELEREVGADDIRRELHNEAVLRELKQSREELEQSLREQESWNSDQPKKEDEDYLPEEEDNLEGLEDPEYPEHLHDHGDPELNPDHPQHREQESEEPSAPPSPQKKDRHS